MIEAEGVDGWFDRPLSAWLGDEADDYEAVRDVLDVWFDSGSTHACSCSTGFGHLVALKSGNYRAAFTRRI